MHKIPPKVNTKHEKCAEEYDSLTKQFECHSSEIIFGLVFEYVDIGDKLLDLGIGTGISSFPFQKAGLEIYGLDNSEEMLNICRKKNIAHDLKLFDLKESTLLYDNQVFDHIIAVGVFHFFKNLENFFKESYRILKEEGTFSFTVKDSKTRISTTFNKEYGIVVYGHSEEYIGELIQKYNFKLLKKLRFITFNDSSKKDWSCFKSYVLMK